METHQLTRFFKSTFLLTHRFETDWALETFTERKELSKGPIGETTATSTRSRTSVITRSRVPPLTWVGPTTNWSQPETDEKSKAATQ
ncbi:hypothetical protein Pmani_012327 [Petrolisthes manimaculis]|uniref:Uncharacterized protein n=1 Tax=Petrolisthes manimaculis TaxID=1843537 RepID=A0AAE1Q0S4_9EUCA|nr:hypothetical protein Pmani_012327 [Petrolisthes manimaculis]